MTKKWITLFMTFIFLNGNTLAQEKLKKVLDLGGPWSFTIGDDPKWSKPLLDDSDWEIIFTEDNWENQGFYGYDGYAWYRKSFDGKKLREHQGSLTLFLGYIDDIDQAFVNGHLIGQSGSFPPHYETAYQARRAYYLPEDVIDFDQMNTIAIRVFDNIYEGGMVNGDVGIYTNEDDKRLAVNFRGHWQFKLLPGINLKYDLGRILPSQVSDQYRNPDGWETVIVPNTWEQQGFGTYDGLAVYKRQFRVPSSLIGETLILTLGAIDDRDWVYINGQFIGSTDGYDKLRAYTITSDMLNPDQVNTLTIYVEDDWGLGGITDGPVGLIRQVDFTRFMRWR